MPSLSPTAFAWSWAIGMGDHPLMDGSVWPPHNDDTQKGDFQFATWIVEQIKAAPKQQPIFLAAGFFLPHVPCSPGSANRVLTCDKATDEAVWEGTTVRRSNPIPQ